MRVMGLERFQHHMFKAWRKRKIAITYSDRARVFFMTEPLEISGFKYVEKMLKWYNINTGNVIKIGSAA